jgi:acyl-CoA oxidase
MFYSTIANLGTKEQAEKWLPMIRALRMTGCYAQTELGHGSYVQGIETTATFDKEKQEFIINSPTITSTKFWPGDMGKFSNHAIVFAKLLLNGKPAGVHAFMMQTRNLDTWELVPGVEAGDIGAKFGYNSKDNGYMLFKNVRVPRANLLSRYADVDEKGQLQLKGDMRALYGIMLETRVWIVGNASQSLAQGLTIATRYAVVRRQFATLEAGNKQERKLMDYQTHMFKFAPLLAYTYAMNFAGRYLFSEHIALINDLNNNEFGRLDTMHHLSAGWKATFSRIAYDGIDSLRQACGGAGFSAHSGLPSLQFDYSPNTTYEGDNTVLLQQAARLIMKVWKRLYQKDNHESAKGFFSYLNNVDTLLQSKTEIKTVEDALCLGKLDKALAVRAAYKVKRALEQVA